jgi:hypothetical protein
MRQSQGVFQVLLRQGRRQEIKIERSLHPVSINQPPSVFIFLQDRQANLEASIARA